MKSKIPAAQLSAWTLVATVGPILSIVGRDGWLTVLLVALGCAVLCLSALACQPNNMPRWLCVLELVWLIVFMGSIAKNSAACWENANAFPAIPIILLAVAAFAAYRGATGCVRMGATLVWLVIPVLGTVFLAGTADINPDWIRTDVQIPDGILIGLLLIPCLHLFLNEDSRKSSKWLPVIIGAIAVGGSVLLDAVLGPKDAIEASNGFYELSKSVNLFGVAERFEALIACGLTLSWFALFAIVLSAAYQLAEKIIPRAAKWCVWATAVLSALIMCILPNKADWMGVGSLIFWVFLPVLTQGIGVKKNIEKK